MYIIIYTYHNIYNIYISLFSNNFYTATKNLISIIIIKLFKIIVLI